jgi:hypothetical protein
MTEQRFFTPLKVGLLAVVTAYFLFTFHGMFTLSWIGEWDRLGGGSFGFVILVEDINATIGLIFRFTGSILAFGAIIYYFAKKGLAERTTYKVLRWVLVFEGIYWLGLVATAGFDTIFFASMLSGSLPALRLLNYFFLTVIPNILEAIVLPIVLFILALKLNPNKPIKNAIKWAAISATVLIAVFWLINTGIWTGVINDKGLAYLTDYPEHLVSFVVTAVGMAALTIYTAYFAKKTSGTLQLKDLKWRSIGAITLALGLFFLWNYFSWTAFAGATWNDWYAWFLGHNMDLFMLSLPLVGLPLLFHKSEPQTVTEP